MQPIMTVEELQDFLDREFPQLGGRAGGFAVADVSHGSAALRLSAGEQHLRPGGTVSGPSLFMLADVAAYVAILAHIGPVALTVTTSLNINFLRRSEPGRLIGRAKILKLGKRLAVVEVTILPERDPVLPENGPEDGRDVEENIVAHATATYSIPLR